MKTSLFGPDGLLSVIFTAPDECFPNSKVPIDRQGISYATQCPHELWTIRTAPANYVHPHLKNQNLYELQNYFSGKTREDAATSATVIRNDTESKTVTDLGKCAFHTVPCYDDAVPLIRAPALEELSGQAALHHARGGHDNAGTDVIKMIHALGEKRKEKAC